MRKLTPDTSKLRILHDINHFFTTEWFNSGPLWVVKSDFKVYAAFRTRKDARIYMRLKNYNLCLSRWSASKDKF